MNQSSTQPNTLPEQNKPQTPDGKTPQPIMGAKPADAADGKTQPKAAPAAGVNTNAKS